MRGFIVCRCSESCVFVDRQKPRSRSIRAPASSSSASSKDHVRVTFGLFSSSFTGLTLASAPLTFDLLLARRRFIAQTWVESSPLFSNWVFFFLLCVFALLFHAKIPESTYSHCRPKTTHTENIKMKCVYDSNKNKYLPPESESWNEFKGKQVYFSVLIDGCCSCFRNFFQKARLNIVSICIDLRTFVLENKTQILRKNVFCKQHFARMLLWAHMNIKYDMVSSVTWSAGHGIKTAQLLKSPRVVCVCVCVCLSYCVCQCYSYSVCTCECVSVL